MIYRKFDKEFDATVYNILRQEGNVVCDFISYAYDMYNDLTMIKKYDRELFNSISQIKIENYIEYFEKTYALFLKTCTNISNCKDYFKTNQIASNNFKEDLFIQSDGHFSINDKYYDKLNKIAKSIFMLENDIAPTVEKIWDIQLTDTRKIDINQKYLIALSAKYKHRKNEVASDETNSFSKDMPFEYASINTNDFTFIFEENRTYSANIAGLIYKISGDAIISASSKDLLSTPFKNGKTPFKIEIYHHSNVLKLYEKNGYEMFGYGTKICTPNSAIMGNEVKQVREIVLDKSKIKPVAVFYMGNVVPERARELQKEYNLTNEPIKIESKNELKFLDLEMII